MRNRKQYTMDMPFFDTKEQWLEREYTQGNMLRKEELVDGEIYYGNCRNAKLAMWVEKLNKFVHRREKMGSEFLEAIPHPEDEQGYDVFPPHLIAKEVHELPHGIAYFADQHDKNIEKKWEVIVKSYHKNINYIKENIEEFTKNGGS